MANESVSAETIVKEEDCQKALHEVQQMSSDRQLSVDEQSRIKKEVLEADETMKFQAEMHAFMDRYKDLPSAIDIGSSYWLQNQPTRMRYLKDGSSRAMIFARPVELDGDEGRNFTAAVWGKDSLDNNFMSGKVDVYMVATSAGLKLIALPGFNNTTTDTYSYPYDKNRVSFAKLTSQLHATKRTVGDISEKEAGVAPDGTLYLGQGPRYDQLQLYTPDSQFYLDIGNDGLMSVGGAESFVHRVIEANKKPVEAIANPSSNSIALNRKLISQ